MNDGVDQHEIQIVVLVCAHAEWDALERQFPKSIPRISPFGQWFVEAFTSDLTECELIYFFTGWGKTSAAAATQYVLDQWKPQLIINAGTCGGFEGDVHVGDLMIPERTIIYDIDEKMTNPAEAIESYSSWIDTSWLAGSDLEKYVCPVLVSADRDISGDDIDFLKNQYGAMAADWESGSISYVASLNGARVIVVRGVSDIVTRNHSEAYGQYDLFSFRCHDIMKKILEIMPNIVETFLNTCHEKTRQCE